MVWQLGRPQFSHRLNFELDTQKNYSSLGAEGSGLRFQVFWLGIAVWGLSECHSPYVARDPSCTDPDTFRQQTYRKSCQGVASKPPNTEDTR